MMPNISRRTFLASSGIMGAALLGGCSRNPNEPTEGSNGSASEKPAADQATSANEDTANEGGSIARPSACGALSVSGTNLIDTTGSAVQLRGFSTHGLAWFPQYVNAHCFKQFSEWGANLARLALYTHENGGYCTDGNQQQLRELLVQGVRYASEADMYCIIDWHVLQDLNPNVYLDQAKDFWTWASAEFSSTNNVLFEICNEPNGSTTWDDVKSYAETIIPIIRKNSPTTPVLVGTPTWCQQTDSAAADPLDDPNVMYTLHFYAGTHKGDLRNKLQTIVESGTPVFVSEYGICDASGNGALDLGSANEWITLMNQLGVSYACWNLSNKAESSSFFASTSDKTSNFADDDLTPCGIWFKEMLSGNLLSDIAGSDGTGSGTASLSLDSISSTESTSPTASLRQSWESGGKPYLLYDISLAANTVVSQWQVTLVFSSPVTLSDSWNCAAQVNGNTVKLTAASYNADIDAGKGVSDIGIIVCSA